MLKTRFVIGEIGYDIIFNNSPAAFLIKDCYKTNFYCLGVCGFYRSDGNASYIDTYYFTNIFSTSAKLKISLRRYNNQAFTGTAAVIAHILYANAVN